MNWLRSTDGIVTDSREFSFQPGLSTCRPLISISNLITMSHLRHQKVIFQGKLRNDNKEDYQQDSFCNQCVL